MSYRRKDTVPMTVTLGILALLEAKPGKGEQPHGRYRLSCPVGFAHRGGEVATQASSAAVRYYITYDPGRGRWYLDASWKTGNGGTPSLLGDQPRRQPGRPADHHQP
jgi:hypothetical protein